jgi:hypothetical protein
VSRQGRKKRAEGVKAPPELLGLCRSVFFALSYDEETIEAAIERAVREAKTPTRAAVKRYLTDVAEGLHDAEDLDFAWRSAARDAQWIIEGELRQLTLELRAALAKSPARQRRDKRHG